MSLHTLAKAVIERAVVDYLAPATEKERTVDCHSTARDFLFSSGSDLEFWCEASRLNPKRLRQAVRNYAMPWNHTDASTFTHRAETHKKKKVWAQIANEVLKRTGDEGRAVREANAAVHRIKHGDGESH